MTLNRLNCFLTFAMVTVVVLVVLSRTDHSRPNYQINIGDDMTYSPAYSSFEKNENFPNGRTMQAPVPDTIPFGTTRVHFKATPEDALRAGKELKNPFELSTEEGTASAEHRATALERGATAFRTYCIVCHGADGSGNGTVAKRGFPPPPSLLTGKTLGMKDGQLFHILTYGQNSMPQFAAQLPPDRRWDVINHIRSLQKAAKASAEAQTAADKSVEDSKEIASETTKPEASPEIKDSKSKAKPEPKKEATAPLPDSSKTSPPDSAATEDTKAENKSSETKP